MIIKKDKKIYNGIVFLIMAEFFFALATVFAKLVTTGTEIPAIEVTFFRFVVGLIVTGALMCKTKTVMLPNNIRLVVLRSVLNTGAVIFFFLSVKYTTLTNSNMLNMTYPVFIFFFAPFFLKEKIHFIQIGYLVLTLVGIYLIVHPNFHEINIGDCYGLISGIVAALAIITLRKARKFDSTITIVFYLMFIGVIINGILLIPLFQIPDKIQAIYIAISAIAGFTGQVFITSGYKYIEAAKGSIVSSSRIIFAFLFGVLIFSEKLNYALVSGAVFIIIPLIGIGIDHIKKSKELVDQEKLLPNSISPI